MSAHRVPWRDSTPPTLSHTSQRPVVASLDAAHQQLGGPVVLVWDTRNVHRSAAVAADPEIAEPLTRLEAQRLAGAGAFAATLTGRLGGAGAALTLAMSA